MYITMYINTVPSSHKYMYQPCHNRITGTTNCNLEDSGTHLDLLCPDKIFKRKKIDYINLRVLKVLED